MFPTWGRCTSAALTLLNFWSCVRQRMSGASLQYVVCCSALFAPLTAAPSHLQGEGRYSLLLNEKGGIIDDCIITQMKDYTNIVLNAGCKEKDLDFLQAMLNEAKASGKLADCSISHLDEQQLIALQGPQAAAVLQSMLPVEDLSTLGFMQAREVMLDTGNSLHKVFIVRCGYTGEDGFEISFKAEDVDSIVRRIAADDNVQLAGLGARDALRLEAGLPLYGNDINEDTTPVEAGLLFAISKYCHASGCCYAHVCFDTGKNRRQTGGFNGSDKILHQISEKSWTRKRVGLAIEGRAPSRGMLKLCAVLVETHSLCAQLAT